MKFDRAWLVPIILILTVFSVLCAAACSAFEPKANSPTTGQKATTEVLTSELDAIEVAEVAAAAEDTKAAKKEIAAAREAFTIAASDPTKTEAELQGFALATEARIRKVETEHAANIDARNARLEAVSAQYQTAFLAIETKAKQTSGIIDRLVKVPQLQAIPGLDIADALLGLLFIGGAGSVGSMIGRRPLKLKVGELEAEADDAIAVTEKIVTSIDAARKADPTFNEALVKNAPLIDQIQGQRAAGVVDQIQMAAKGRAA